MTCLRTLVAMALLAGSLAAWAEEIDSCSTLLGSIGVELRYARQLPRGERTTFACPRDTSVLIGASRQRVLAALGTPDDTAPGTGDAGPSWDYWFGPAPAQDQLRQAGQPGLRFEFDSTFSVRAVSCQRHP